MNTLRSLIAGAFALTAAIGMAHASNAGLTSSDTLIYREDTAPRGGDNERAGDRQRRGKAIETFDQLAREDAAPRGGDNERAGDRQRRGRG